MKTIKELMGNMTDSEKVEVLRSLVSDCSSWNGSLEDYEVYENDDEFFDTYFSKTQEAVRAVFYGKYNYMDEYVKFDGYGNLKSMSEYDYEKYLLDGEEEIIEVAQELWNSCDIDIEYLFNTEKR